MQAAQRSPGTANGTPPSISAAHQRALIPSSSLEFPTQRLYAISIFVLLQALKLYDAYGAHLSSHPEQYSGILLKWWFIDSVYMFALWVLQIPWLQFSGLKSICLALLLILIDLLIFTISPALVSGIVLKAIFGDMMGKQLGVSRAKMVNVKDIVYNSSHILGRHTVHILPYGTAKLNPSNEFYCIPGNQLGQKDIYIPIVLNNTIPRKVTISRYDFDTQQRIVSDYSGRDIQRATEIGQGRQGIEYYYVRVRMPGAYKLENIVSKDGLDVRLYSRQAYVFVCPTARFVPGGLRDYCSGEKETLDLEILGVPPLRAEYTRRVNNERKSLRLDRIQPDNFDSPLARISDGLADTEHEFFTPAFHDNYNWAATQHLSIKLNLTFERDGEYEYQLNRIVDGAGNVVEYPDSAKFQFYVHEHPTAQMDCSATDPVKLLIGHDTTDLPLKLRGTGPWTLEYQFSSEAEDVKDRHLINIDSASSALRVSAPGEYKLLRVSDKYCKGDILFPSTCQVIQPPLPAVNVQATPIPSECAGDSEIGMKFAVEFQGTPPFVLEYQVVKHTGRKKAVVEKKRERVDRSRHVFTYLPSTSGEYTYEFTSLDDRNYKNRDTQIQPIKQIVHPQPDARFSGRLRSLQSIRTCIGEDISLEVELSGTGPFNLVWTFAKQLYSDVVDGNKYIIKVPPLETPGLHVVSLVKIQDANECVKGLEARDVLIDVRRDRPTAFFYTENKREATALIAEGETARLPLRLTGEGPWKVSYRNVDKDGKKVRNLVLRDPNAEIEVKDAGHYELVSVEDAICLGDPLPPRYTVQWIDKPRLWIDESLVELRSDGVYERRAVCEGVSDAIDLLFKGHGPFSFAYDEYYATPKKRDLALLGTQELSSGLSKSRIPLKTRDSGTHRYVFNRISDQRYTRPIKMSQPLILEQTVHPLPSVKFASKSTRPRTVCVGDTFNSEDIGAIHLELVGQAPFTVRLGLKHQSELYGKTIVLENIETNRYKLDLPNEVTTPGRYDLHLLDVQDRNGCSSDATGPDTSLSIEALDIATITPIEQCREHCVGDTLEFSLSGVGPFTVSYQFNGRNEKVKSQSSRLTMIADKPGNLTIISVGDQRNKCRSFPKDMTKIVHEIPSSLVSGGKEIIENIREGDMVQAVVDLIGTPPFDFEWQRSEAIWDSHKKRFFKGAVLESHTVHNVYEHRYYINTSTEGIIEVVRIKDNYCHYPSSHIKK